jgi:hypothetical protein
MYYLGIVGALSSLGQGVTTMLQERYPGCKIVFKVDDRYPKINLLAGEFQTLEQVISRGITPTLVLDFGLTEGSFERAKFYRAYGIPAIMQGIFGPEKMLVIKNARGLSENVYPPLVLIPDFSVTKLQVMKALKSQAEYFANEIKSIKIDVLYNTQRYNNFNQWIYWAQQINSALGKDTAMYRLEGHALNCGYVHYMMMHIISMDKNDESITVQIMGEKDSPLFSMEMRHNLLASRISGVATVLNWYFTKHGKTEGSRISNQVFVDVLSKLI